MSAPVDTTTATTVTMVTMAELDAIGESIGRSAPLPPERTRTRETLMGLEALRVTTDVACRESQNNRRSIARAIRRSFPACDQRYATIF